MSFIDKLFPARFQNLQEIHIGDELALEAEVIVPLAGRIPDSKLENLASLTASFTALSGQCGDGSFFNDSPKSEDGRVPPPNVVAGFNVAHAIEHITTTLIKVDCSGAGGGETIGHVQDPRRFTMRAFINEADGITPGTITRKANLALKLVNDVIGRG